MTREFLATLQGLRKAVGERATVAERIAQNLRRILDETESVPLQSKGRIRDPVEASIQTAAPYLFWRLVLHALDTNHFLLMLVGIVSALPIVRFVGLPFWRDHGQADLPTVLGGLFLLAVVALAGLLVGAKLMEVLTSVFRRSGGRVPATAITAAILFLAAGGLGALPAPGWLVIPAQRGLQVSGIFITTLLLIGQGIYLAQVFMVRLTIRKAPTAEVVTGLLLALEAMGRRRGAPEPPALEPTEVVNHLRQLADTMERALPRRFPGLNPESERQLRAEARAVAAAVDRIGMDALLSGREVRATLGPRLGAMLVQVAEGDWGALARGAPAARPSRLHDPWTIVVALVPLLLGLALRWRVLPVDVPPQLVDGLVKFGVAWALVHALASLDPQANEKIGRAERLLKVLP